MLHGRVLPSATAAMLGPHLLGLRDAAPELTEADGEIAAFTFLDLLGLDGTYSTFVDQAEAWIIAKRRSSIRLA